MVALKSRVKEVHEFETTVPLKTLAPIKACDDDPFLGLLRQGPPLALSPVTSMAALNMMPSVLSGELSGRTVPETSKHDLAKQLIAIEVVNNNDVDLALSTLKLSDLNCRGSAMLKVMVVFENPLQLVKVTVDTMSANLLATATDPVLKKIFGGGATFVLTVLVAQTCA